MADETTQSGAPAPATESGETPKTSTPVSTTRPKLSRSEQAWAVQPGVSSFGYQYRM